MIHLTAQTQILLAVKAVDFRKQIDSLMNLCKQELSHNPRQGTYFVFINRARTMIRVLSYDGNGYWLCTKRLSQGRFNSWPSSHTPLAPCVAKELSNLIKSKACTFD